MITPTSWLKKSAVNMTILMFFALNLSTAFGMEPVEEGEIINLERDSYGTLDLFQDQTPQDDEITCLTKAFDCLGITYKPVEIRQADYDFAQILRPLLADLSNFKNLSLDQKALLSHKFLEAIQNNFSSTNRFVSTVTDSFDRPSIIIALGVPCDRQLNCYSDATDQSQFSRHHRTFISKGQIDESVIKALLIDFILHANVASCLYTKDFLQDYCIADLVEILREECGQVTTVNQKALMAIIGVDMPNQICERLLEGMMLGVVSALLGGVVIIATLGALDHLPHSQFIYTLPGVFPAVLFCCVVTFNCLRYKESKKHKPADCVLF